LNIKQEVGAAAQASWPEMPVLRSDLARDVPIEERVALQQLADADETSDLAPTPPPPAESPGPGQDVTREQVQNFVESYLRDGETDDAEAQVRYFAFPLKYLWHGQRDRSYVAKDVANYVKRWPDRKYMLTEPVQFMAGQDGETIVEFPLAFSVRNQKHHATGRTRNVWTIKPEGDELKIVSIWEERLRN
jgi:hypothetical protein